MHDDAARARMREFLAPNFAKPHEDLGRVLLDRRQAAEAESVLKNAVRLDPGLDEAWFNLGKHFPGSRFVHVPDLKTRHIVFCNSAPAHFNFTGSCFSCGKSENLQWQRRHALASIYSAVI